MGRLIQYPEKAQFLATLKQSPANSQDFVLIITGAMGPTSVEDARPYLDEAVRILREGGLLFVQGEPSFLPELGVYLDQRLRFKYWIAIESALRQGGQGLPSVHAAVLLFSKGEHFNIQRVRFPHEACRACGRPLRDWGGKTHLMHPEGYAISDVWKGLPSDDNYTHLSTTVAETLIKFLDTQAKDDNTVPGLPVMPRQIIGIVGPKEGILELSHSIAEPVAGYSRQSAQLTLPGFRPQPREEPQIVRSETLSSDTFPEWNVVLHGDALDILKKYPDDSVDLVFADPPYNLDKAYNSYEDERDRQAYLGWCNTWLEEYIRILKPTGSLYVLNLPRWGMYHAAFLSRRLYFQNWIVWDALSEPRGKLMPAHYALLFYTKHPSIFTFNYSTVGQIDAQKYCLRSSCIRSRKAVGDDEKEPLTDFWWNIHRLKHRRDRDYHPCQLPDSLMERIIELSTNPGDVVLDALAGTGTTAVAAARLDRRYVAIDIDESYVCITREKLAQVEQKGYVYRPSVPKVRARYTKKALQLELRELATRLGRLPTPEDARQMSRYGLDAFLETFPTWGKALKAAKLEVYDGNRGA